MSQKKEEEESARENMLISYFFPLSSIPLNKHQRSVVTQQRAQRGCYKDLKRRKYNKKRHITKYFFFRLPLTLCSVCTLQ